MMQELRHACRRLRRAPVFAGTVILILSLTIGANTTVFSLLHAMILRPLPAPAPEQLVQVSTRDRLGREADLTWGQFQELLRHQRVFSTVIGWIAQGVVTIETARGVLRGAIAGVTGNYFDELGAVPALGRLIQASDLDARAATGAPVAVVSWSFWHRHYGGDPAVIGQSLRVEDLPLTIIGVAPRGFLGLGITIEPDVTIPLTLFPRVLESEDTMFHGTSRWVATTGRLAPGTSVKAAREQITAWWPELRAAAMPPGSSAVARDAYLQLQVDVTSGAHGVERGLRGRYTQPLYTLLAIAAIVFLIAAVNLCGLVFVRLESSRAELGVRLALGASRARLAREFMLEGALLGIAGAAGGMAFATYASEAITGFVLRDYLVPTALDVAPDTFVTALTVAAGVGIGLAMMAVAAWMVTAPGVRSLMPGGTRSVTRSARMGKILVVGQTALSMVLLTHASLLARNLHNINAADSGLTSETVLVGSPQPRVGAYRELPPDAYYREALARVRAVPGVVAAAFTQFRPERGAVPPEPVGRADFPAADTDLVAETSHISPGLFEVMGIPILEGRDFTDADTEESPRVAIISRHLARQLFGEERAAIGQRIRVTRQPEWQNAQVIGIAGDARLFDLRGGNLSIVYIPALQTGPLAHYKFLIARAPANASRAIQHALESLGAEVLLGMQTLAYWRGRMLLQERLLAGLGSYFGLLALGLVATGVYGLLSYVLSLRRKEMGIRMALGADAGRLALTVIGAGLGIASCGLVLGVALATLTVRFLRSVLAATSPYDPWAVVAACGILLSVTTLALLLPALRAAHVDPATELRRE